MPPTSDPELDALLHRAVIASLDQIGWLRVTGADRVRWLNGMATNFVQALAPGTGVYNFFLNAQGRIQGDGNIFALQDELLIETPRQQIATLIPYLDHYIIMDDVELADISDSRHGLTVIGPQASSLLTKIGLPLIPQEELKVERQSWGTSTVDIHIAHGPLVPRFELWVGDPDDLQKLRQALESAGAAHVSAQTIEYLRLLEGTPLYGTDIRDRDLPQETNQARALHFNKGCYLGQEIVERIRSRGNVHRTLTSFRLEGTLPAPGVALQAADKAAGELTSVAALPLISETGEALQIGLGYARREALDRHDPLHYEGGIAHPAPSPFFQAGDRTTLQSI
ncbi:folate-binding protein YgfZ [Edaphobacter sp. 12200R-103]|nr:folate-binding protein YgfZ [Edaphobacter sp. 12200R-103]